MRNEAIIVKDDAILGGRPVFRGTRIQAEILFENLAEGYSLAEIIASFPTLDAADLRTAILQACERLLEQAPNVTGPGELKKTAGHARISR